MAGPRSGPVRILPVEFGSCRLRLDPAIRPLSSPLWSQPKLHSGLILLIMKVQTERDGKFVDRTYADLLRRFPENFAVD
jgi:hypothetical protein